MQRVVTALLPRNDILRYSLALLLLAAVLLVIWPHLAANLFATGAGERMFMPHIACYLWIPQLYILHLSSDLIIGISYVAISLTLAYLVYRARRDIPFHWVFLAFGLFIIACGGTHLMEVWSIWHATYWLSGYVKLVTAVASLATAIVLPPLVPKTLDLIQSAKLSEARRSELENANKELAELYAKVKEADQIKTQFFADLSRELPESKKNDVEALATEIAQRNIELGSATKRLSALQTITDGVLAHLTLPDLLNEMIKRLGEVLRVDTVAILLMEPEGNALVAWTAKGLEEEVERRVRIPLGKGFAGQIAAERKPLIVNDLDRTEVVNPLLAEKGIRSLMGVPLLVEGQVTGVVHVGTLRPYQFTGDDMHLLQLVADRISTAIENARLYEFERAARAAAEEANRAKDEFLTTLSHELRTPLTPILGWVHMMRTGMLAPADVPKGLSVIDKNSLSLKRLINDLLDMSAIMSGKMRIEEVPVPVTEAVLEAVETMRPHARERSISLQVTLSDQRDSVV